MVQTLALRSNAVRLGSISSSAPRALSAACGLRRTLWLQGQAQRHYSENKRAVLSRLIIQRLLRHRAREASHVPAHERRRRSPAEPRRGALSSQPFRRSLRRFLAAVSCSLRSAARDRRSVSVARSRGLFARRTIWLYRFRSLIRSPTLPSPRVGEDVAVRRAGVWGAQAARAPGAAGAALRRADRERRSAESARDGEPVAERQAAGCAHADQARQRAHCGGDSCLDAPQCVRRRTPAAGGPHWPWNTWQLRNDGAG